MQTDNILKIENLGKYYPVKNKRLFGRKQHVRAVDGVSLDVEGGTTLGIVGESGCGKSTLAKTILMLTKATSGKVWFKNQDILTMCSHELRNVRRDIQFIFQDPFSSLNPRMKVKELVIEPLVIHKIGTRESREVRAVEMLEKVGLKAEDSSKYPHESRVARDRG